MPFFQLAVLSALGRVLETFVKGEKFAAVNFLAKITTFADRGSIDIPTDGRQALVVVHVQIIAHVLRLVSVDAVVVSSQKIRVQDLHNDQVTPSDKNPVLKRNRRICPGRSN